jgi:hypothetical protein
MAKPYIDTYENEEGDIVLVYVAEVRPYHTVEPQHIIISPDHIDDLIAEMKKQAEH